MRRRQMSRGRVEPWPAQEPAHRRGRGDADNDPRQHRVRLVSRRHVLSCLQSASDEPPRACPREYQWHQGAFVVGELIAFRISESGGCESGQRNRSDGQELPVGKRRSRIVAPAAQDEHGTGSQLQQQRKRSSEAAFLAAGVPIYGHRFDRPDRARPVRIDSQGHHQRGKDDRQRRVGCAQRCDHRRVAPSQREPQQRIDQSHRCSTPGKPISRYLHQRRLQGKGNHRNAEDKQRIEAAISNRLREEPIGHRHCEVRDEVKNKEGFHAGEIFWLVTRSPTIGPAGK